MSQMVSRRSTTVGSTYTSHLKVGNQVFHNGVPVQLLYIVNSCQRHETWHVRPLFIEAPDRDEEFHPADAISFLHTIRTRHLSRAA